MLKDQQLEERLPTPQPATEGLKWLGRARSRQTWAPLEPHHAMEHHLHMQGPWGAQGPAQLKLLNVLGAPSGVQHSLVVAAGNPAMLQAAVNLHSLLEGLCPCAGPLWGSWWQAPPCPGVPL